MSTPDATTATTATAGATAPTDGSDLPLRADLAGMEPYGAPQLDVPVRLNTNENPYPPSPALAHEPLATVAALRSQRDELVTWLRGRGLRVADSDANFVLFGEFGDRHRIWQALLDRGVLIRETGPRGWLRVTAGTPAEMSAFRHALDEVLTVAREDEPLDPAIAATRPAAAGRPGSTSEASR